MTPFSFAYSLIIKKNIIFNRLTKNLCINRWKISERSHCLLNSNSILFAHIKGGLQNGGTFMKTKINQGKLYAENHPGTKQYLLIQHALFNNNKQLPIIQAVGLSDGGIAIQCQGLAEQFRVQHVVTSTQGEIVARINIDIPAANAWVQSPDGSYVRSGDSAAYKQSYCNKVTHEISEHLRTASKKLSVAMRNDARHISHMSQGATLIYSVAISWLKTIPLVGGYVGLLNKIVMNPGGGAWEVSRSAYGPNGSAWNLWGDNANGVSSSLTLDASQGANEGFGLQGYNLATGSPTLFQQNQRMKLEQAESEMMGKLKIPGINDLFNKRSTPAAGEATIYLQNLEAESLWQLKNEYDQCPAWYDLHALGAAQIADLSKRDGIRDLEMGNVLNEDGSLIYGDAVKKLDNVFMSTSSIPFSKSNFCKVLEHFRPSTLNNSASDQLGISIFSLQKVQQVKAKYVAYWDSLTKESIWSRELKNHIEPILKKVHPIPAEALPKSTSSFSAKIISAMGFIHELLAAYFGSGRISSLPPTELYCKQATYALADCAASAASYMSRKEKKVNLWYDWFKSALIKMPEYCALLNMAILKGQPLGGLELDITPIGLSEFAEHKGKSWHPFRMKQFLGGENAKFGILIHDRNTVAEPNAEEWNIAQGKPLAATNPQAQVKYRGIDAGVREKWAVYKNALATVRASTTVPPEIKKLAEAMHEIQRVLMNSTQLRKSSINI